MIDAGHVEEELAHLALFPIQLFVVGEMLVLAASTFCEEAAGGLYPMGARVDSLEEVGVRAVGLVLPDAGADSFLGKCEGNKDYPAVIGAAYPRSQVGEGIDPELDDLMVIKGFWAKLSWGIGHGRIGAVGLPCQEASNTLWFDSSNENENEPCHLDSNLGVDSPGNGRRSRRGDLV